MSNQSGKIMLVLALLLLIASSLGYFLSTTKPYLGKGDVSVSQEESKGYITNDFYSENLNIYFQVPEGIKVEEKFTDVILSSAKGEIQIRRIGTNFNDINAYMENLEDRNKVNFTERQNMLINGNDFVLTLYSNSDQVVKEYSMYKDSSVFKISTSNQSLYPELDQLVQSFEYRP